MRQVASLITALIAYATVANAHARVTSPPIRTPGPNHLATCGQSSFNRLKLDETGHIEEQQPITQGKGCELTLCRGMLFSDQPASNIQRVTPGQPMAMAVDCTIPHGGPANVSLIDTTVGGSGRVIGSFLKTFSDFCPTSGQTPADQTNLQFNLPTSSVVGNNCQKDGDCVVQLFWATPDFSQNYYYCVDVTMKASVAAPSATTQVPPVVVQSPSVPQTPATTQRPVVVQAPATPTVVQSPPIVQSQPVVQSPPVVQSQPAVESTPVVVQAPAETTATQPVVQAPPVVEDPAAGAEVPAAGAEVPAAGAEVPAAGAEVPAESEAPAAVETPAPAVPDVAENVSAAAPSSTRFVTVFADPEPTAEATNAPQAYAASAASRRRRVLWFSF